MRRKQEMSTLYVKMRVGAKIDRFGKAKGWEPVLARTRKFANEMIFDRRAEDETQARNAHFMP